MPGRHHGDDDHGQPSADGRPADLRASVVAGVGRLAGDRLPVQLSVTVASCGGLADPAHAKKVEILTIPAWPKRRRFSRCGSPVTMRPASAVSAFQDAVGRRIVNDRKMGRRINDDGDPSDRFERLEDRAQSSVLEYQTFDITFGADLALSRPGSSVPLQRSKSFSARACRYVSNISRKRSLQFLAVALAIRSYSLASFDGIEMVRATQRLIGLAPQDV